MNDIINNKIVARKELHSIRNGLSEEYRSYCDSLLFFKTINSDAYNSSDIILAYYPVKSEPGIIPIIDRALEDGKRVAMPVSDTENFTLTFRYINSLSDLHKGAYSIPEPLPNALEYKGEDNALCIVPALAFDRRGVRIGYGKGFYDRFLESFGGVTLGLCYSKLLVEELPAEKTDASVDIIITEKEEIINVR